MHTLLALGAVFGFLAVVLGAFGAHALRNRLTVEHLAVFQTGVQYQMYHSLALVAVGALQYFARAQMQNLTLAGWFFVVGIVLFSGSLYVLCLTGIRKLGAITPLGGLFFLLGWVWLFLAVVR